MPFGIKKPPFKCIFCNLTKEKFSSKKHIVPHSLGNNFLILDKGWVCDKCNNKCSQFESKVINHSIFGMLRAVNGVITKKGKPSRSKAYKVHWNAIPTLGKNSISVDKQDLEDKPFLKNSLVNGSAFILPAHTKYDSYISKLLLKIGVEFVSQFHNFDSFDINNAKRYIISENNNEIWPYFIIQTGNIYLHFISIFKNSKYIHSHALASGFDLYFNEIDKQLILCFKYGFLKFAVSITSNTCNWTKGLDSCNIRYVGFPIDYVNKSSN